MNLSKEKKVMDVEKRRVVAEGEGVWERNGLGVWDQQMQTIIYKMYKQSPTE